jgi:hypothetical protein
MTIFCMKQSPAAARSAPHSPRDLVVAMRKAFVQLDDYQCVLVEQNLLKPDERSESTFVFKKPKLLRLDGTAGRSKGAQVILDARGKPHLRKNGISIPTFFARDDLRDFAASDFGSLIATMEAAVAAGKATVAEGPDGLLELRFEQDRRTRTYRIDPKTMLPVMLTETEKGKPVSKTEWRDLKLNVGLKVERFKP